MIDAIFSARCAAIIAATLSMVQIAPIKINPWSWLFKKIGCAMNGEVIKKVDCIENEIKCIRAEMSSNAEHLDDEVRDIREDMAENKAITARVRILRFNDELLENKLHTKDAFDQCLSDIDNYEHYCATHKDFKNNMTVLSIENIKRCYGNCMNQRDFVRGSSYSLPIKGDEQ